jgi:hypothetical protein
MSPLLADFVAEVVDFSFELALWGAAMPGDGPVGLVTQNID